MDAQTGWFLGKSDADPAKPTQLYQTGDGGKSWELLQGACPVPLGSALHFVDQLHGFAVIQQISADLYEKLDARGMTTTALFYTEDGGKTWQTVDSKQFVNN